MTTRVFFFLVKEMYCAQLMSLNDSDLSSGYTTNKLCFHGDFTFGRERA